MKWHRHQWTAWGPPQEHFPTGFVQTRTCELCGKIGSRRIRHISQLSGYKARLEAPPVPLERDLERLAHDR